MNKRTFTRTEIVLVGGIILLLNVMLVTNIVKTRFSANEVMAQAILRRISDALEQYSLTNKTYPSSMDQVLEANPPYINIDFFSGSHAGYNFTDALTDYSYSITATRSSGEQGKTSYTHSSVKFTRLIHMKENY